MAEHGGALGAADEGLLEAALASPQNHFAYEGSDLHRLAAAYAFSLAKNHPFTDGNKRVALTVAGVFLELNVYRLVSASKVGAPEIRTAGWSAPGVDSPSMIPGVEVLHGRIATETLRRIVAEGFGDMVKYVVDVERKVIAIGGQLHSDGEAALLEQGSRQDDLWGANYYPGTGPERCIEFTSLINIRPARANPGMELGDTKLRDRVREVTFALIGRGEDL
jgi:hypothetical protein